MPARPERTIGITILTFCVIGLIIFIQEGAFILPGLINEAVFGVITIYFAITSSSKLKWRSFFAILGLLSLINSRLLLETVLSNDQLESFITTGWSELFHLIYALFIALWGIVTLIKQKKTSARLLTILFIVSYSTGMIYGNASLILIGFISIVVSVLVDKRIIPFHLLWILLLFIESSAWINYLLN